MLTCLDLKKSLSEFFESQCICSSRLSLRSCMIVAEAD